MRKLLLLISILYLFSYSIVSLSAQVGNIDVDNVKKSIRTISDALSDTVFANTLTASTWNTAYKPKFVGIGFNATVSLNKPQYLYKFSNFTENFSSLTADTTPGLFLNYLFHIRAPIPLVDWPFDIGLYGFNINFQSSNTSSVVYDDFLSLGFDMRWNFFKNHKNKGLITSFTYFYQSFGVGFPIPSFKVQNTIGNFVSIVGDYKVKAGLNSHTFGFKGQYSQLFLGIIELTGGIEPYFGFTNLRVSSSGDIVVKTNGSDYSLTDYIDQFGLQTDFFSGSKITFKQDVFRGGLRLYGGFSLKIFFLFLDSGISYEPFHGVFGGFVGTRLVF